MSDLHSAALKNGEPDKKPVSQIAWNTATDTGVGFESGNTAVALSANSPEAAFISASVGVLCALARATGEAKITGTSEKLSHRFENFSAYVPKTARRVGNFINSKMSNLGTSLMISGGALLGASIVAGQSGINVSSFDAFYNQGKEAVILGCFGVANFIRGYARAPGVEGSVLQKSA